MSKKLFGVIAAVAVSGLLLTGCSPSSSTSDSASDDTPFNIYFSAGLSGPLSGQATAQQAGIKAAVEDINANGGVLGHQIELTVNDDGGDPTKTVSLYEQYADSTTPNLVIPGQVSNNALALMPELSRSETLSLGLPNSSKLNDPATYPYYFATNTQNSNDGKALADTLKADGYKTVGLICANDALGQDIATIYTKALADAGITATVEQFDAADVDFTSHLQRVQAGNPDAIVLAAFGPAVGYTLKSRTQLGITTPLVAAPATADGVNFGLVSSESDWGGVSEVLLKVNSPEFEKNAGFEALDAALSKAGVTRDQLMEQYTFAWDQVYLAYYAAVQANSISGADMANALENFKAPSDSKLISVSNFSYSADNHFLTTSDEDYTSIGAGPAVDGTVTSAGS